MMATMADAHREWHLNAGVPMGTPGCPQDACHPPEPWCYECCDDGSDCPECRVDPNVGTDGPAPGQCECGAWWCTTDHDASTDTRDAWAYEDVPF